MASIKTRAKRSQTAEWSIRITPTNQMTITKDEFLEKGLKDAELLLVCEEGEPDGSPKLHYHIYIKTNTSRTTLERYCANIGRSTLERKGNAVFSIAKANPGVIGYVIKDNNIVCSLNYSQTVLEQFWEESKQYKRDLETTRKKEIRKQGSSFKEIIDEIKITSDITPEDVMDFVLSECVKRDMNFPSKSMLETAIVKIMYRTGQNNIVRNFYLRNIVVNDYTR